MIKFYNKDPSIVWTKPRCNVCGRISGPKSKCEELGEDIPELHRKIMSPFGEYLPVLGPNCVYKQHNVWQIDLNYPVSEPLVYRLSNIAGIEKISVSSKYTFLITIGKCFDEALVKKETNSVYNTFVKEMQSKEELFFPSEPEEMTGLRLPDGTVVPFDTISKEQTNIASCIINILQNSSGIFSKDQNKNRP